MQHTPPGSRSQKRPQRSSTDWLKDEGKEMEVRIEPNGGILATARGIEAVHAGAAVLDAYIRSQAKLKFGLYCVAALFMIIAATLVVFAPDGREIISSILAVALFVVAVGCAGFSTFALKTPVLSALGETATARHGVLRWPGSPAA
jgi:hypothetical protein